MAAAISQAVAIFEKLQSYEYRIGEKYWVDVSYIKNPHSFYVRPVVFREDLQYLQEYREQVEPGDVKVGKVVIYKSHTLDLYVRGEILKVVPEGEIIKCDLRAIDYGCVDDTVPFWNLRYLKNPVAIPPLTAHCLLADSRSLEQGIWGEDTIEAMKSYIGNEHARMTVVERTMDQLGVKLFNSCPNDIATMLTMTGYTALGSTAEMPGGYYHNLSCHEQFFECRKVKLGDVLHVRCQIGKTFSAFYVAEVTEFKKYLKQRNHFTDYCLYQQIPKANELSIGKAVGFKSQFMTKFERSIVKEIICPTKVVVQKIDWGDVQEANTNHLRLVKPKIFGQTTAVALYCRAIKNQEMNLEPSGYLSPGVEFLITIKEVGENFNIPHIVEISKLQSK